MYHCVKGAHFLRPFNTQKGGYDFFLLMLWHNHCFAQMCLLIGTVSQVKNMTHGPIVQKII